MFVRPPLLRVCYTGWGLPYWANINTFGAILMDKNPEKQGVRKCEPSQ